MSSQTLVTVTPRSRGRGGAVRFVGVSAAIYVAAWAVGLFVSPSAPASTASADAIHSHFVTNHGPSLFQSYLVHGIAGIAHAAFSLSSLRVIRSQVDASGKAMLVFGLTASTISLLQVAFAQVLFLHISGGGAAETTRDLFDAINKADTAKLVLLGAFVPSSTLAIVRGSMASPWTRRLGTVTAGLLTVGGAAVIASSPVLNAVLIASLPALLLWVASTAVRIRRAKRGQ